MSLVGVAGSVALSSANAAMRNAADAALKGVANAAGEVASGAVNAATAGLTGILDTGVSALAGGISTALTGASSAITSLAGSAISSLANSAIGGTIQAILGQQIVRTALTYAIWGEISYDAPEVYIAGIPVSVRTQEVYQLRAEATRHAIESGANYTDHVILEPIRIDLYFEVSNISDGFAAYVLGMFKEMWHDRQPLDLLTEHKKIKNCVLTSFHAENQAPFWGKLVCQATFEQINKVTLETQDSDLQPTETTSTPNTSKSAEPATNSGTQTPKSSALYSAFH